MSEPRRCCNCGRVEPEGGLRLTTDLDRWICRRPVPCIEAVPIVTHASMAAARLAVASGWADWRCSLCGETGHPEEACAHNLW